jgi:hypothetical protein
LLGEENITIKSDLNKKNEYEEGGVKTSELYD